jgi:nitrous oxidase accessory protein
MPRRGTALLLAQLAAMVQLAVSARLAASMQLAASVELAASVPAPTSVGLAAWVLSQPPASARSFDLANALQRALPGDTVRVPAGVHRGSFVIDRAIVVTGEPGAVLDGGGVGNVVTIKADSVTLSSLRIIGSGMSLDEDHSAVRVEGCTGCALEQLVIERPLHGIYLANSAGVNVRYNQITGDLSLQEARRGNGIHLYNSTRVTIANNVVSSTRDGIYFSFATFSVVEANTVTGVRYGLHYMYSNDNSFDANSFRNNAAGGAIMFSDRIVLTDNDFSDHVGSRAYGLLLQTTTDVRAEGNRFSGNLIGLFIDNSTRTLFRNNRIVGNGIGVDLMPSSRDNTLVGNWFVGNRTSVRIARGSGKSTWAVQGRGNYWEHRSVFDLDGDGVGDRPLKVGDAFATLAQARPVLEVFSGTPAALALSWAEEAVPAFALLRVEDPFPLLSRGRGGEGGTEVTMWRPILVGILLTFVMLLALVVETRRRAARTRGSVTRQL